MNCTENIFKKAIVELKEVSAFSAEIVAKWITKAPTFAIKNEKLF